MYLRIAHLCRIGALIAAIGLTIFFTHRWRTDPMLEEVLLAACQTAAILGIGTQLVVSLVNQRLQVATDNLLAEVDRRFTETVRDLLDMRASADVEASRAARLEQLRPNPGRRLASVED